MRDSNFRARLYESYASDHAGVDSGEAVHWVASRDFLPHLPADRSARVIDVGYARSRSRHRD